MSILNCILYLTLYIYREVGWKWYIWYTYKINNFMTTFLTSCFLVKVGFKGYHRCLSCVFYLNKILPNTQLLFNKKAFKLRVSVHSQKLLIVYCTYFVCIQTFIPHILILSLLCILGKVTASYNRWHWMYHFSIPCIPLLFL